eukprot:7173332-Prymnesium_polylepis.2
MASSGSTSAVTTRRSAVTEPSASLSRYGRVARWREMALSTSGEVDPEPVSLKAAAPGPSQLLERFLALASRRCSLASAVLAGSAKSVASGTARYGFDGVTAAPTADGLAPKSGNELCSSVATPPRPPPPPPPLPRSVLSRCVTYRPSKCRVLSPWSGTVPPFWRRSPPLDGDARAAAARTPNASASTSSPRGNTNCACSNVGSSQRTSGALLCWHGPCSGAALLPIRWPPEDTSGTAAPEDEAAATACPRSSECAIPRIHLVPRLQPLIAGCAACPEASGERIDILKGAHPRSGLGVGQAAGAFVQPCQFGEAVRDRRHPRRRPTELCDGDGGRVARRASGQHPHLDLSECAAGLEVPRDSGERALHLMAAVVLAQAARQVEHRLHATLLHTLPHHPVGLRHADTASGVATGKAACVDTASGVCMATRACVCGLGSQGGQRQKADFEAFEGLVGRCGLARLVAASMQRARARRKVDGTRRKLPEYIPGWALQPRDEVPREERLGVVEAVERGEQRVDPNRRIVVHEHEPPHGGSLREQVTPRVRQCGEEAVLSQEGAALCPRAARASAHPRCAVTIREVAAVEWRLVAWLTQVLGWRHQVDMPQQLGCHGRAPSVNVILDVGVSEAVNAARGSAGADGRLPTCTIGWHVVAQRGRQRALRRHDREQHICASSPSISQHGSVLIMFACACSQVRNYASAPAEIY